MTFAICIKCASQKFGALTACDGCGFTPKSEKEIAQSLVYCDHILVKEVLAQLEAEFKGRSLPDLEPEVEQKMMGAAREAQKTMGLGGKKASTVNSGAGSKAKRILRYILAVVLGATGGFLTAAAITMLLYVFFEIRFANAHWIIKEASIILICFVTGCVAGWIAGRREKLIAALAHILLLGIPIAVAISNSSTPFFLIGGIIPAVLGGHVARKTGAQRLTFLLGGAGILLGLANYITASTLHITTAILAYKTTGFLAAGVTLCLPVASELYWFFSIWNKKGTIINGYDLAVLAVMMGFLLQIALATWVVKIDNKGSVVTDDKDNGADIFRASMPFQSDVIRRNDMSAETNAESSKYKNPFAASAFFSHAEEGSDPWV